MENKTKINRILKGLTFFAVFAFLGANAYGQPSTIKGDITTNDSNRTIIHDSLAAAGSDIGVYRPDPSHQAGSKVEAGKNNDPELGEKIIEVTQVISQYIVLDEDRSDENHVASPSREKEDEIADKADMSFSLALTSSYINNYLLDGRMKLEFRANPVEGGGAIFFRKTF